MTWSTQFDARELQEIAYALTYKDNFDHGTSGHLAKTVIAKLINLLDIADSPAPESSISVSGYALPIQGQASEWYFANQHRPTYVDGKKPHSGLDINLKLAPFGDVELGFPLYSTCAGLVVYANYAPGSYWGNLVITASKDNDGDLLYWRYAHLQSVLVDVGQIIPSNKLLGTIGKGAKKRWYAHLHLDVWRGHMILPGAWFHRSVTWLDPLKAWADAGYTWNWGNV